jgi:HAD superfamily 5'-nucleotidase-like hydrolase
MPLLHVKNIVEVINRFKNASCCSNQLKEILFRYELRIESKLKINNGTYLPINKNVIFANNYLNLGEVKVVGFDLDYTLISYTIELQNLIYTEARDRLISFYGFPKELKNCNFDPNFAVRGLSVDLRNGILCKLNHLQHVGLNYAFKGKKPLRGKEMENIFGLSRHVKYDDLEKMRPLNDMYTMAEACLIADTVEIFESIKAAKDEAYSPAAIVDDVQGNFFYLIFNFNVFISKYLNN